MSVCSGIEAASVAWHPLGWQAVAFAEIEKFPSAVLAHHYPGVPNWGDLTRFKEWPDATIDLLVGGTPCQSFSVAGLRKGLDDPRGNLALTYLAVADRYRPRWLVWENVPGVLSSGGGRDFGAFLGGLGQLGYRWVYRSLDAQYFGLAQRRRRVFVVAHLGDWRRAAAVLLERESLSGHPAPRREAGERVTGSLAARTSAGGGLGTDLDCDGGIVPVLAFGGNNTSGPIDLATACQAHGGPHGRMDFGSETFIAHALVPIDMRQASRGEKITNNRAQGSGGAPGHGVGEPGDPAFTVSERGQAIAFSVKDHGADAGELSPTLRAGGHDGSHANGGVMPAVAFDWQSGGDSRGLDPKDTAQLQCCQVPAVAFAENQRAELVTSDTAGSLKVGGGKPGQGYPAIQRGMQVRRLTPRECERLQGFPDDYTLIPYGRPSKAKLDADFLKYQLRGNPKHLTRDDIERLAKDGPRYKALGNSMAVPVMAWIGRRIALVESICEEMEHIA